MTPPTTRTRSALVTATLVGSVLVAGCGSGTEPSEVGGAGSAAPSPAPADRSGQPGSDDGSASAGSQPATVPGRYVELAAYDADRAAYADSQVVLFFHAPWCPDCRATEESLRTEGVPDGLTVVKVDFDSESGLRQEYGVTVQHTFVAVEPDGNQLKKWTGTLSGQDIADQLS